MSLSYVVDGETDLDSLLFNPIIDRVNGKGSGGLHNVEAYGATNNGFVDSTDAITAAWNKAAAANGVLFFPPGDWLYSGPGLSGWDQPNIIGAGVFHTHIVLAAGSRLIDDDGLMYTTSLRRCYVDGGAGAIRYRNTGQNVVGFHVVKDCYFQNYTEAAIESNASDMPYWKVHRNYFRAANTLTSMGVALSGWVDSSTIVDNSFVLNRVALKLGSGGVASKTMHNDFIRFSEDRTNGPCLDVWLVPGDPAILSGASVCITENKFGNESLVTGDYRIVVADEGVGATFGSRFPVLDTVSTGEVSGVMLDRNDWVGGSSSGQVPFVYATTPRLRHWDLGTTYVNGLAAVDAIPFKFHADAETDAAAYASTRHEGLLMNYTETPV